MSKQEQPLKIVVTEVLDAELALAIAVHGGAIKLIKYLRWATGCNLIDAKRAVDEWRESAPEYDAHQSLMTRTRDKLRDAYVPPGNYDLEDYDSRRQFWQDRFNYTSNVDTRDLCDVLCQQAAERAKELKTYRVSWKQGRKAGAIGIMYPDQVIVRAASPEAAKLKAHETHEHLLFVTVEEVDGGDS